MQRKFLRAVGFLLYGALATCGVLVLLCATLQIEQRIFRYRAEQLYNDITAIQLRHTTFDELEPMLQRWNADVTHGTPCFKQHCDLAITIRHPIIMKPWNAKSFYALLNVYRKLGGRWAVAIARIHVRNGFVWGKDYLVGFDVAPFKDADGRMVSYYGQGLMSTMPRADTWRLMHDNPEFEIRLPTKCWACVDVRFTPYADPQEVRRLSAFNFSCLTAWHPCRYRQDIAPAAFAELAKERLVPQTETATCDLAAVRIISRDTDNAGVFDVIASRTMTPDPVDARRALTVRLVQRVKRALFWSPGEKGDLEIEGDMPALPPLQVAGHVLSGERVIVLFERSREPSALPTAGAETCGVIPYSKENLQLVRAGAAEDERVEPLFEYDPEYQPRTGSDLPGPRPPPAH